MAVLPKSEGSQNEVVPSVGRHFRSSALRERIKLGTEVPSIF